MHRGEAPRPSTCRRPINPPPHRTAPHRQHDHPWPVGPGPRAKRSRTRPGRSSDHRPTLSQPSTLRYTAHRHPPAPQCIRRLCRMPRSLVGGDLAVPETAHPYMKKDDDDEDGYPPLLHSPPLNPTYVSPAAFPRLRSECPLPVLVCRI